MARLRNIAKVVLLTSVVAGVSGCATRERVVVDPYPSPQTLTLLSESAMRAAKAQEDLARIQAARTAPAPKSLDEGLSGVPEALRRNATISWSGPGEAAAERLARLVGYRFQVVGSAPATVPMVSVSYVDYPAVKIFEDIGYQSAPFAQVYVDAGARRVEYRYLSNGRAPAPRASINK